MSDNIKKQKRIIAEESQSPDRWLREPRNNQKKSKTKERTHFDNQKAAF